MQWNVGGTAPDELLVRSPAVLHLLDLLFFCVLLAAGTGHVSYENDDGNDQSGQEQQHGKRSTSGPGSDIIDRKRRDGKKCERERREQCLHVYLLELQPESDR